MIRVVIADDHPILRAGVRRLLEAAPDIRVAAEVASGDAVLAAVEEDPVDVVLLDVSMPGRGFLEVLGDLRERHPRVRVVVLSAHAEEEFAERSLKAGAMAYVHKERTPEELLEAVRRAQRGIRYVSDALAQRLAARLTGEETRPDHSSLSNREYEVLQLLGRGKSVKEIAALLGVSPKTVSTYRERILEKLRLTSTAQIIAYAVRHGLTD